MRPSANVLALSASSVLALVLSVACVSAISQAPAVPKTEPALVAAGRERFSHDCASCHGAEARGGSAPDLVRSVVVLHDRGQNKKGIDFAAVLKANPHKFDYNDEQLLQLSQFLTFSVNEVLRSESQLGPSNLLAGNAMSGKAFFLKNCAFCHSVSGDLAAYGTRFTPVNIQQRFVFPNRILGGGTKKPRVTVTSRNTAPLTGNLVRIDDFNVTLGLPSGALRTIARGPGVKVRIEDPLSAHYALLDRYTDDDIHNITTYLETLK